MSLVASILTGCSSDDGAVTRTIAVDGRVRSYLLYRPSSIDRGDSPPLVVVLHGGFGRPQQARAAYDWDDEAASGRFVVVYPAGMMRSWNAGTCCAFAAREDVDDVGFIDALIDRLVETEDVDPARVYVTGISNGGMLAYRLACELPGKLAAIGPVAASLTVPCTDPAPSPTSLIHVHGLDDLRVQYTGGPGEKGVADDVRPAVPDVIARWRAINGCRGQPTTDRNGAVTTTTSSDCDEGTEVRLVTVAGAGHQWPGGKPPGPVARRTFDFDPPSRALDATETIWKFFSRQER